VVGAQQRVHELGRARDYADTVVGRLGGAGGDGFLRLAGGWRGRHSSAGDACFAVTVRAVLRTCGDEMPAIQEQGSVRVAAPLGVAAHRFSVGERVEFRPLVLCGGEGAGGSGDGETGHSTSQPKVAGSRPVAAAHG
jgi:hypothetical protein